MSSWLKAAGIAAGVVLVGVIAIAALPAEAVVAGIALLVVGRTATAAPINTNKKP
jgi:hypothetical protein